MQVQCFDFTSIASSEELIHHFESGANQGQKQQRASKQEDVRDALFLWFRQKINQGAGLSGSILKQKASELAHVQGSEFSPSDGWLSHWKAKHNISYKKEQGEKLDVVGLCLLRGFSIQIPLTELCIKGTAC